MIHATTPAAGRGILASNRFGLGTMSAPPAPADKRARARLGLTLKGKYRLEGVLGMGGMAVVYLGVHRNGLRVAVKMLHPELSADAETRARFVRESYLANSIDHRAAVRVLDDDVTDDGAVFLVMDLLEGETLQQRAKRKGGSLSPLECLILGHQLGDALGAAHDKGIVHRDVKPENLFLTRDGVLKVLDFGIARLLDASAAGLTATGHRMGTPAYMPPEQALGRAAEVDARTDVWAAGATLFTLLSGHFVHDCETAGELVVQTATRPARSLAVVAPEVPDALIAVVDRALSFAREGRFPSARALRDALAEAYAQIVGGPIISAPLLAGEPHRVTSSGRLVSATPDSAAAPSAPPAAGDPTVDPLGLSEASALPTRRDDPRFARGHEEGGEASETFLPPSGPSETGGSRSLSLAPLSRQPTPAHLSMIETSRSAGEEGGPGAPPSSQGALHDLAPETAPRSRQASRKSAVAALVVTLLVAGLSFWVARSASSSSPAPPASATATAAPSAAAVGGCTENGQCSGDAPSICRKDTGTCVALETAECKVFAEKADLQNDATVWFGAMFPRTGPDAPKYGEASVESIELGRRDFAEAGGGLPSAKAGGKKRPIGLVVCDDAAEPEKAASHLVNDVGVPAILGFHRSKEVLDLAQSLFIPRGVLALASNTASMLSSIPHAAGEPRLVFRTTTSADMVTAPVPLVVSQMLEPEIRAQAGAVAHAAPIRLALVRINNTSGLSHADIYATKLQFNGKGLAQNRDDFLDVVIGDGVTGPDLEEDDARAAQQLLEFKPHIIIVTDRPSTMLALERRWPKKAPYRPRYLVTTTPNDDAFKTMVAEFPDARFRLLGLDTRSSSAPIARFVMRHNAVFPKKILPTDGTFAPYDAFYALAYAAVALRDQPLTGKNLARAIGRLLPPGEPVEVGQAGIYKALAVLDSGKNIDLVGTTTSLDFNLETGDATADFAIYCLHSGAPPLPIESGVTYDARKKTLEGQLRCP